MDRGSDYTDEMDGLTPAEVDDMLAGRELDDPVASRLSGLVRELREELLSDLEAEEARRHVAAMVEALGGKPASIPHRRHSMVAFTRKRMTLLGVAATLALGMGVAAAVTLPEQASDRAEEVVGSLPDPQPTGTGQPPGVPPENANDHGEAVSEVAHDDSLEGCEKGMTVSGVASSKAAGHRQDDPPTPDPCLQASDERAGPGGGGGGSEVGGGGSEVGGGGSGSGGPGGGGGGGGGGSEVGGGGGSGSGGSGSGGGSGGGGSTAGGGPPDELPTPEDVPAGGNGRPAV
jgi:hypothetical protein